MNLTFSHFSLSLLYYSPLISQSTHYLKSNAVFNNLKLNSFATYFFYSQSKCIYISILNSYFNKFLINTIKIQNSNIFYKEEITKKIDIVNISILNIVDCVFINCSDKYDGDPLIDIRRGGAIYYEYEDGNVTIYGSLFDNCFVENGDGGALFICGKKGSSGYTMTHKETSYFESCYCCYSNCQAFSRQEFNPNNASTSGYGPIMHIFANDSKLYYSSGTNSNSNENLFYGAQFDVTSLSIFSEYINSTGGKSHYCTGIEYRNSLQGYFRYQTFVGQEGRYINSFRDITFDIEISFANFVNVSIVTYNDGGIINANDCFITLFKICFVDIILDQHLHFINGDKYTLVLRDCLISKVYENLLLNEYIDLINITFYDSD